MKILRTFTAILICCSASWTETPRPVTTAEMTHVSTALDHLTVLEFSEPVTSVAAGSDAFHIEWKDNKVFVKPLRAKAATDLFIWTGAHRHGYELETTGDVPGMSFAIDNPAAAPAQPVQPQLQLDDVADMVLTRAFLGMQKIELVDGKAGKEKIVVRIAAIFQTKTTAYVHYTVENRGTTSYRLLAPTVSLLKASHPHVSLVPLKGKQLRADFAPKLGATVSTPLRLAHSETSVTDLLPGHEADGVVAVRQTFDSLSLMELGLGSFGGRPIKATVVF